MQNQKPSFVIFENFGGITDGEADLRFTEPTAWIFEVHEEMKILECLDMTFTKKDCRGVSFPHSDPLVMMVDIAEQPIYKVLIDTGAEVNVILKNVGIEWMRRESI